MKRYALFVCALAILGSTGCDDDPVTEPGPTGEFSMDVENLPSLSSGFYQAWVSFPAEGRPGPDAIHAFLHDDTELVSLGAFRVDEQGAVTALDGAPMTFVLAEARNLNLAVEVLIAVQADGDLEAGPILLGGEITGDNTSGRATLTTSYDDALGTDLATATGTVSLATPTDGPDSNESSGAWFADLTPAPPAPSLSLPSLAEGWIYEGWVDTDGTPRSLGRFADVSMPDSDGAGPDAGTEPGFALPGSDLLDVTDLRSPPATIYITVEDADLPDSVPLPIRALWLQVPTRAEPRTALPMARPETPMPTAVATFAR